MTRFPHRFVQTVGALSTVILLAITAAPGEAALITNGGFEESDGTGWMLTGNASFFTDIDDRPRTGDGLVLFNAGEDTPDAVLSQSFTTVASQEYVLEFFIVKHGTGGGDAQLDVDVFDGGDFTGTNLLDDTATFFGSGVIFNSQDGKPEGLTPFYEQFIFTFTADSTTTTLRFTDTSTDAGGFDTYLDDVSVVIPSPAALPAGLALLGLTLWRRRR